MRLADNPDILIPGIVFGILFVCFFALIIEFYIKNKLKYNS